MEGGKKEKGRNLFIYFIYFFIFYFLFYFILFFSLFKTMKICFGATKIEIFYREKAFHTGKCCVKCFFPPGKKIRKNYFAPSEKFSCYAPTLPRVNISLNLHYFVLLCTSFIIPLCSSKFLRYYVSNLIS